MEFRSSNPPPTSGAHLAAILRSLGTIAASLPTCPHPEDARVSATVLSVDRPLRLTWCSYCGAIATGSGQSFEWQPTVASHLLARPRFEELSQMLHAIRAAAEAVSGPKEGADASLPDALRVAIDELACSPLVLELERLDRAIAQIPQPLQPLV